MMVMHYVKNGSMIQYLKNNYNKLNLLFKLWLLCDISNGLRTIHNKGLIHKDLHSGNLLANKAVCYITDLRLYICKPVDEQENKNSWIVTIYRTRSFKRQ